MGAYVEAPADIDQLMHLTGPEVGLLFDSGHAMFAGGDAVAVLARTLSAYATCTARTCGPTASSWRAPQLVVPAIGAQRHLTVPVMAQWTFLRC